MSALDCDVLVVGGAVAGLATALLAAHHGLSVIVVEKHASTSPHPRARSFSQRSLEALRGTMAAAELERLGGVAGETTMAALVGETLAEAVPQSIATPVGVGRNVSPSAMVYLGQDRVEPVLARAAAALGASVRFGHRLLDWRATAAGVEATVDGGNGAVLRAAYLVAADGARSAIREQLGIACGGRGCLGYQISALVELPPALRGDQPVGFAMLTHPVAGGVLVATDVPGRFIYSVRHDPQREPAAAFTDARWQDLLRMAIGAPSLHVRVLGTFAWEAAERWAERFADDRVFLVGDAAHQMLPAGGHGANTAIQDAANLAWKLALVRRGIAAPQLLTTYDRERRPVAIATARQATALGLAMSNAPPPPGTAAIVDDAAVVFGYRYGIDPAIPAAFLDDGAVGTRAPHAWLADGRSTLDVAGRGFALLVVGGDWQVSTPLHGVDVIVCPAPQLAHRAGLARDGALLVRPDGVVAARWTTLPADPRDAVAAAVSHVLAGRSVVS